MTTFTPAAEPMPDWWHPLPADLPERHPEVPTALDPALTAAGRVVDDLRQILRASHRLLGGAR